MYYIYIYILQKSYITRTDYIRNYIVKSLNYIDDIGLELVQNSVITLLTYV